MENENLYSANVVLLLMYNVCCVYTGVKTLQPRQKERHFADDIFKCIFLNESVWIPIWILLKFVPKGPINNLPALVQIMVWRCPGDKPLAEPMMVSLPTHIRTIGRNELIVNTMLQKSDNKSANLTTV